MWGCLGFVPRLPMAPRLKLNDDTYMTYMIMNYFGDTAIQIVYRHIYITYMYIYLCLNEVLLQYELLYKTSFWVQLLKYHEIPKKKSSPQMPLFKGVPRHPKKSQTQTDSVIFQGIKLPQWHRCRVTTLGRLPQVKWRKLTQAIMACIQTKPFVVGMCSPSK